MDRPPCRNDEQLGAPAGVENLTVSRRVSRSSSPMTSTDAPSPFCQQADPYCSIWPFRRRKDHARFGGTSLPGC
eukprot:2485653-Pyramimonas_sp.AAC.1